jgi:hypothetical protein
MNAPAIRSAWPGMEGSKYAGIAAGQDSQPDYHLILLADKPAGELNWKDAIAWAEKLGATLPTRDESALLYAHLRGEFESGWHWTGTQYSSDDAWAQLFSYGTRALLKSYECRARAVRRLAPSILRSFEGGAEAGHDERAAAANPRPDEGVAL